MIVGPRLVCPFCRQVVADGEEPVGGDCAGCGARYAGGADSPPEAVARALAAWGVEAVDPAPLARALFDADPGDADTPATVVSDERDGFYRWWMFIRAASDPRRLGDMFS